MTGRKRIRLVIIICSIGLAGMFLEIFYTIIEDGSEVTNSPIGEYQNLFTSEAQGKMQIQSSVFSRNRGPSSTYVYDDKFDLFIYKVRLSNNSGDLNLNQILKMRKEITSISMNAVYSELPSYNFEMRLKGEKVLPASIIYFSQSGDALQNIAENDSLFCYYSRFKTFSVKFDDEPYDVIAEANRSAPLSILFLKRNKFVYIMLLTVAKGKEEMKPDLLYNMIKVQ